MPSQDPGRYQSATGGSSSDWFGGGAGRVSSDRFSSGPAAYKPTMLGYKGTDHKDIVNLGPEKFTNIQIALMNAGYADKLRLGVWDSKSSDAMKKLMGDANNSGTDWQTQLSAAEEGAAATEAAGGGKKGQVIDKPNLVTGGGTFKTTAHEDLQVQMMNTFNDLLAEDPSSAEQLLFIADQRNREVLEQAVGQGQEDAMKTVAFMQNTADVNKAAAGQGTLDAGGDITVGGQQGHVPNKIVESAASPAAAAELIARTKYPEKYGATIINKRLGSIMDAITSGSSGMQRPLAR